MGAITDGGHRATVQPINEALHAAQSFAIHWIRRDSRGSILRSMTERAC